MRTLLVFWVALMAIAVPSDPVVGRANAAFSSVGEVHQVSMMGLVTKHSGSTSETGTVTISAKDDGSGTLALVLAKQGNHSENFSATSAGRSCIWSGADGQPHDIGLSLCTAPLLWFFPSAALQSGNSDIIATDEGVIELGGRQLRVLKVSSASSTASLHSNKMPVTPLFLGLDPNTLFPSVIKYSIHPDEHPELTIDMEVEYSSYSSEQGIQIPHLIQRRLNGALDFDLQIQSVTVH